MLRLTQIELLGFKSFPHKTVLDLSSGINCVVGPNGSGKSNVADAIMFAFGNQSSRELRTSNLSGLIFAGTDKLRPLNMASVTLHFERSTEPVVESDLALYALEDQLDEFGEQTGAVIEAAEQISASFGGARLTRHVSLAASKPYDSTPAVMKQLAELTPGDRVSLTRRVFRDGTGGYYINGEPVRLKDVDSFFDRYHLGRSAVFSVSQGEVERKILASPQEMREWLAEATGVALLLAQKDRAQGKLKRTAANLERLSDIQRHTSELVTELTEQRGAAEQHLRISRELRAVELNEIRREVEFAQNQLDSTGRALSEAADNLTAARTELEQRRSVDSGAQQQLNAAEQNVDLLAQQFTSLRDELEHLRRDTAVAERSRQAVADSLEQSSEDDAELEQQVGSLTDEISAGASGLSAAREQLAALRAAESESNEQLKQAEAKLAEAQELVARTNADSFALAEESARVTNQLEAARRHGEQLRSQLDSRDSYLASNRNRVADLATELENETGREQELRGEVEAARERLEQATGALAALGRELLAGDERAGQLRSELAGAAARRKAIAELDEHPGHDGAVKLLEDPELKQRLQRCTDVTFPAELRDAFTRVLAQYSDALAGPAGLRGELLSKLDDADATLLTDLSMPALHERSLWRSLSADDSTRAALVNAIGDVVLADDVAAAEALLAQQPELAVVTRDGRALLTPRMSLLGRPSPERARQVSRRTDLNELDAQATSLQNELDKAIARQAELKASQAKLQWERDEASSALATGEARLRSATELLARLRATLEERSGELKLLEDQQLELSAHHEQVSASLPQLEQGLVHLQQRRVELDTRLAAMEAQREAAQAELDNRRVEAQHSATQRQLAEQQLSHLEQASLDLAERLSNARNRREQVAARIAELQQQRTEIEQQIASGHAQATEHEQQLEQLTAQLEQSRQQRMKLAEELRQGQGEVERLAQTVSRLEQDVAVLESQRERAAEKIGEQLDTLRERFGLTLTQLLADPAVTGGGAGTPARGPSADRSVRHTDTEWNEAGRGKLREEKARLRAALDELGNVNLLAIEQHSQQAARLSFLTRQTDDLRRAVEDLTGLVDNLDQRTEQQYSQSLKRIEHNFNEMFVTLFGEGWAKLRFDDPERIIDSGVEVEVQIPGGRRHNLRSLSGGQRSLIFLALFFAVHNVRSPGFCILDEADAALDDANVARFAKLIERFAGAHDDKLGEQFIVVTHNKRSMEIADRLIGVVGRPKGVSNLLEVDLTDAKKMSERTVA